MLLSWLNLLPVVITVRAVERSSEVYLVRVRGRESGVQMMSCFDINLNVRV